ncbi:hypothetical protein [Nocardioides ferulae]|uniref:hypothetical protein n=1 Tax=Nocardioides ferulae TaxID=2340821 RepID=UPI000F87F570|nr:hypothetical protein [Nocardioides ferulae]
MRTRSRRVAMLATGGLVAALLPTIGIAAPAGADPGCPTETAPTDPLLGMPTGPHCDDTMPPETADLASSPAVNDAGYVAANKVAFTFTGAHPAADSTDTDPVTFQCRLFVGPTAPAGASWSGCQSGDTFKSISGESWGELRETRLVGQPYTFEVRAVDSVDSATDITSRLVNPFFAADTDAPDLDETPERVTFSVDTEAPLESTITGKPVDPLDPRWPMLRQPRLELTLEVVQDGGSAVGASCELDEEPVLCEPGPFVLTGLRPGDHIFKLSATDAAGNREEYADRVMFSVPRNLKARKRSPWKTVAAEDAFAGDLLTTRRVGAQVRVPAKNVQVVRLIAPRDSRQGRVEVYAGKQLLRAVSLAGGDDDPFHVFTVRPPGSKRMSRPITIRVVRVPKGGAVRLDAIQTR